MRAGYLCQSALRGMIRAFGLTATSTTTLAVGLWLMGLASMTLLGGRETVRAWAAGGHITCGIAGTVAESKWPVLKARVAALPGVRDVAIINPSESLAALQQSSSIGTTLAAGITASMLPASLRIEPAALLLDVPALASLAAQIATIDGLEDVDYGATPIAHLRDLLRNAALWALGVTIALALALTFMVMSTIRLMLYSRQDEVQILQLIGATPNFVRAPFLLEGVLWGLTAGLVAGVVTYGCQRVLSGAFTSASELLGLAQPLRWFCWPLFGAQLLMGALLGLIGSTLAVHAFVREDLPSEV